MADESLGDFISGWLRPEDWRKRRDLICQVGNDELWAKTFEEFLKDRLFLRYLSPIKILQDAGTFQGEGFTIVSIQCALIEFLAALRIGKNYKFSRGGSGLLKYEYSESSKIFCNFLLSEEPFKQWFVDDTAAKDFYKNVRCALLHEARTKNGWKIWASGEKGVDVQKKIVRRDALQGAIETYIEMYGEFLLRDKPTQEAFIRKFDNLADL